LHCYRIEHRAFDILCSCWRAGGGTNIENAHAAAAVEKGRYQVLSDKAAAARNKRLRHGC